jgi:hypothetical protein
MAATKFKGKNLSLTIGGTEFNADITSVVIESDDADDDVTTFADLAAGGARAWTMTVEAVSDYSGSSLWGYLWENAGDDGVAYVLKPYGNATPTVSQPHFTGTLDIGSKPNIGGTANETFTFEYALDLTDAPTRATA